MPREQGLRERRLQNGVEQAARLQPAQALAAGVYSPRLPTRLPLQVCNGDYQLKCDLDTDLIGDDR